MLSTGINPAGLAGRSSRAVRVLCFAGAILFFFGMMASSPASSLAGEPRRFEWFWVFYERDSTWLKSSSAWRPFYVKNSYPDNSSFEASLMPLAFWRYRDGRRSEWKSLFGLVDSLSYVHENGVPDYDFGIFPLLFFGCSPDRADRYFFLLPLGGTIKGKLAHRRISAFAFPGVALFFLFPPANTYLALVWLAASLVPAYVDYEASGYKAWGVFWPLIQRGVGPGRDDIRVLPFYAHNYKKDMYDNYNFFLIINYQRVRLGDDEQKTLFVFPLFARRWNVSGNASSSALLWPFFSWGYNRKTGDRELNFPWPLVMMQDCESPYIYKRIFFPFFGLYRYERSRETFFITPLYFRMKSSSAAMSSMSRYLLFVVWSLEREYRGEPHPYYGNSWRYFKIWPLFHYERDDRGNASFNLLSLLPLRDPDGYELLYQPFWTIFEYRRLMTGERRLGFVMRLYYQAWGEDFLSVKLPLLFCLDVVKDELTRLTFFCSMFGYVNDDGRPRLKLFWLPIGLGRSGRNGREPRGGGGEEVSGVRGESAPMRARDVMSVPPVSLDARFAADRGPQLCARTLWE